MKSWLDLEEKEYNYTKNRLGAEFDACQCENRKLTLQMVWRWLAGGSWRIYSMCSNA